MPNEQTQTPVNFADLSGRTAVVTGSSSGIGRAIAYELAFAGAHVLVHARSNRTGGEATMHSILKFGRESSLLLIDLADPAGQDEFVDRAWNWRKGVDVWVNNAGGDVLTGERAGWTFEQKLEWLWKVDVSATIRLSRQAGRRMLQRAQPQGVIINIGWDQAETGMAGESGELFAATKGAIMSFTKSLARTLAPNVRVNCVAPGWIRTAWGDQASEYWQDRAQRESLLGRWGTPLDVARTVRFLASSAADFITGQILAVDGGIKISP